MRRKIAVLGANEQQNPLILRAREMGLETHVFAWQSGGEIGQHTADHFYPISARSKEDILAKCRQIGIDAVTSIGSDMAALSAAYVAEELHLPGNSYASTVLAANKLLSRELFGRCGFPQPAFAAVGDELPLDALKGLRYPLVVKPSDRSGGRGLRKVNDERDLYAAIDQARDLSFERRAIVEEYVEGTPYSCECISFRGRHTVLGYTERTAIEIGGRICERQHEQPANLPASVEKRMQELCGKVLSALGIRDGASSIEFIVSEGQISLVEVTPAMYGDYIGTDLVPAAYGYDYLRMVIDVACGREPDLRRTGETCTAVARFVYAREDGWPDAPEQPDGRRHGHCIRTYPLRQFGGPAPLSVPEGEPYYREDGHTAALDSELTALWYALKQMGVKRVHLPYYLPAAWERAAREAGAEPVFYHIDERFLPADLSPEGEDAVVLVNCHGLCGGFIAGYEHPRLIIDNSMAFFHPPILRPGVYNIYSCRKFFPVTDGAYLIGADLAPMALETDLSYKRARALLLSLELGEGAAYRERQAGEQELSEQRRAMSPLTRRLLGSFDYEQEKKRRCENFALLHRQLARFNLIPLSPEDGSAPQFYPLLVDADIRALLLDKKIYVPLMWRRLLDEPFAGTAEQRFARRLYCLPIDPRYRADDMDHLARTVSALLS